MARKWTEAEKKAFGEKMKRLRAEKAALKTNNPSKQTDEVEIKIETESPHTPTVDSPAVDQELLRIALSEIQELKEKLEKSQIDRIKEELPAPALSSMGETIGLMVKFPVEKNYYPDPTADLIKEDFLKRFAFADNFLVKWDVKALQYETKWGTSVVEPKFTCVLYQKQFDEDGNPTDRLVRLSDFTFFEDPATVRQLMVELDVDTTGMSEKEIYDLVRYHRIKEWLKHFFLPPKNVQASKRTTEEVIGGRVVVMEEASSVYDGV
jgi:hypothetical protein